ncbi:methyltransferase domain-containing protein [Halomonas campisalis]|uniref:Methyltransferase domain-containing protein n=1 Tax=Billgrantia campisalis TaxID=74661 RepID=A0ABS9PBP5_9GAMM|nr:class I SAM-dependent methyltransferase [Halomonas campisalis]MCG6659209.1 methyltransferase domain-containing protein [Halomonas campisalis]MDR5864955.1 methyltransferase domain-containing protein [Halomonas campisalis]
MTQTAHYAPGQAQRAHDTARLADLMTTTSDAAVKLLAPRPGERILELGCGDGTLTEILAKSRAQLVGIDASDRMVEAARARGLQARQLDAHQLPFDHEFDAVFSSNALHWLHNHEAVIAGVRRALKPKGRFVAELGGHGNVAAVCTALIAALEFRGIGAAERLPWYFPTIEAYREMLTSAGFTVERIELIPQPMPLPGGMSRWLASFAAPVLHDLDEDLREAILDNAVAWLAPSLCDSHGHWTVDCVRLRFKARA